MPDFGRLALAIWGEDDDNRTPLQHTYIGQKMKRFRIELRGENFLLNFDGEPRKFGFTLSRYLRAADETIAEKTAAIMARQLPTLQHGLCNDSEDPPRISMPQIKEVNPLLYSLRQKKIRFELLAEEEPLQQP